MHVVADVLDASVAVLHEQQLRRGRVVGLKLPAAWHRHTSSAVDPEEAMLLLRRPRAVQRSFWCGNGRLIECLRRHGREARVSSEVYARVLS